MAGDLSINQLTVATTTADADKLYYGKSPFGVTDDRAITYSNFKSQLITTDTYAGLSTTSKTVQGAINEVLGLVNTENTWDRVDFGSGDYFLMPHTTTDGLYIGALSGGVPDGDGFAYKAGVLEIANTTNSTGATIRTTGIQDLQYLGGVSASNVYSIMSENISNAASMTGTENGIKFRQWYYDAVTPLAIDEGFVGFRTTMSWDSDPGSQMAYFMVRTIFNGVLTDTLQIAPNGYANFYNSGITTTQDIVAGTEIKCADANNYTGLYLGRMDIVKSSTAKTTTDLIRLYNKSYAADMDGTGTGILFYQYVNASSNYISGRVSIVTETDWTTAPADQDSKYIVEVAQNGALVTAMSLSSDKSAEFYNKITLATSGIPGISSQLGILSYYNGIQANFCSGTIGTFNGALQLTHVANNAAMTNTENGIFFNQYYYDASTPAEAREGFIGFGTEGNWTSTTSTQNSFFIVRTVYQNNWVTPLSISSGGIPTFPSLNTDGGIVQTTSAGIFSTSKTLATGITAPDFNISSIGNGGQNKDYLTITNTFYNQVGMQATGTSILFRNYYYDATPAAANSARIEAILDGNWTSTAATQNSSLLLYNTIQGVSTLMIWMSSNGVVTVPRFSLTEGAAPADPASGYSRLFIDAAGLTSYKVNHGGSVTTPFTVSAVGIVSYVNTVNITSPSVTGATALLNIQSNSGVTAIYLNQNNASRSYIGFNVQRQSVEKWFIGMGDIDDALIFRQTGTSNPMILDSSGNLTTAANHILTTGGAYLGGSATDGTWYYGKSGNDIIFQRRESGSYVTKATITSAGYIAGTVLFASLASTDYGLYWTASGTTLADNDIRLIISSGNVWAQKRVSGVWGGGGNQTQLTTW